MIRGSILTFLLMAFVVGGCGGPYKGKPDRLPKVKKSKAPEEPDTGPPEAEIIWDEECNAKFVDDANKAKKSPSKAQGHVSSGDDALEGAGRSTDPQTQLSMILASIDAYKKALLEDHYNPAATFGLAVAYAQVRKKGCSIKMLKRLGELNNNPRLAGGQSNLDKWLNSVEDEAAFKPFKVEAMGAVGR